MKYFEEFCACPKCGSAITWEKKKYFVCPSCGKALCTAEELPNFKANFCGNCGKSLTDAKNEALTSVNGDS